MEKNILSEILYKFENMERRDRTDENITAIHIILGLKSGKALKMQSVKLIKFDMDMLLLTGPYGITYIEPKNIESMRYKKTMKPKDGALFG